MPTSTSIHWEENGYVAEALSADVSSADYMQDDIARCLRTSLVEVLTSALANESQLDFLKGVLSLARCQADLYGIPWHDLVQSLCAMPELCGLIPQLQESSLQGTASPPTR
jgi:hypothetical protein